LPQPFTVRITTRSGGRVGRIRMESIEGALDVWYVIFIILIFVAQWRSDARPKGKG
jgi:hypothetical protein